MVPIITREGIEALKAMPVTVASKKKCTFNEVRPCKDKRGADLISDALPFGRLWYGEPNAISNAIGYAKFYGRSHDAVIRFYDEAGNVIVKHEHNGFCQSMSDNFS